MKDRDRSRMEGEVSEADQDRFVSKGAAFFPLDSPVETRDFYFMMLPKMTMLLAMLKRANTKSCIVTPTWLCCSP